MIRTRLALVTLVSAAMVTPALAQYKKKPPNRVTAKAPFAADAWGPKQGRPGTRCWVDGRGFRKNMTVLVGGRQVRLARFAGKRIEFDIPRRGYGDGKIVLRRAGYSDVFVGTFAVLPDPAIARFGPRSGVPGTRVEIRGTGFDPGLRVMMNGRAIRADDIDPRRVIFRIPAWAKSDYIELAGDGYKVRTRRPFQVLSPAPVIRGVNPAAGTYGTVVRITGEHFDGREQVFYGRRAIREVRHGRGWVEFTVPDWARRPRQIRVRNQYGDSTWPQPFGLALPPQIQRFAPSYGGVGTEVTIFGRHFDRGDYVTLGGAKLPVIAVRPDQIRVKITPGARSGRLKVHRGGLVVAARRPFDVELSPVIRDWGPKVGDVGTVVTLRGDYFGRRPTVYYGPRRLRPRAIGRDSIEVVVPGGYGPRRFRVVTRAGEVRTGKPFALQVYPVVRGINPRWGSPGSQVRINGQFLGQANGWFLGKTPLRVVRKSPREVVVQIPDGASPGKLWWNAHGSRHGGKLDFDVRYAPIVSSLEPAFGPPGTLVTIRGRHLGRDRARVTWGPRKRVRVVKSGPGFLTVEIPRRASGQEYLFVEYGGQRVRSGDKFQVRMPAVIDRLNPGRTWRGGQLVIHGDGFGPKVRVRVGGKWWPIKRIGERGRRIWIDVPRDAPHRGRHWVEVVKSGGYVARSPDKLILIPPPGSNIRDKRY